MKHSLKDIMKPGAGKTAKTATNKADAKSANKSNSTTIVDKSNPKSIEALGTPMITESKYQPSGSTTWCNKFAIDLSEKVLGANPFKDVKVPNTYGMEAHIKETPTEWQTIDFNDAWTEINKGSLVLFFSPGHVATGIPTNEKDMKVREIKGVEYKFGNIIQGGRDVGKFPLNQGFANKKLPSISVYKYSGNK